VEIYFPSPPRLFYRDLITLRAAANRSLPQTISLLENVNYIYIRNAKSLRIKRACHAFRQIILSSLAREKNWNACGRFSIVQRRFARFTRGDSFRTPGRGRKPFESAHHPLYPAALVLDFRPFMEKACRSRHRVYGKSKTSPHTSRIARRLTG